MNIKELEAQAKHLAPVFVSIIKQALADQAIAHKKQLNDLRELIKKELAEDIEQSKRLIIEQMPTPKDGENGKSISVDDVKSLIESTVKSVVSEMPKPKDGASVSLEDVRPLVDESVKRAVCEIPKPEDGKSVSIEDMQKLISKSVDDAVSRIPKPKDGEPGRDALSIDIIPSIDFEKSYPRGTFAHHDGGLWGSHSQTQGKSGWSCIVHGSANFDMESCGDKGFKFTGINSLGVKTVKEFVIPAVVYRGIYKEGCDYTVGDMATRDGSVWHCKKDSPGKPGIDSDGWTLAVKKGRAAR